MMKKYFNFSLIYAFAAMAGGVFFREFTKLSGFTGQTSLSVVHTHYFMLGMFFFLILALCQKNFEFSGQKGMGALLIFYNIGLNVTGLTLLLRGILQVLGTSLPKGVNAALSGVAGIGHIITGVCIVLLLLQIKKGALKATQP